MPDHPRSPYQLLLTLSVICSLLAVPLAGEGFPKEWQQIYLSPNANAEVRQAAEFLAGRIALESGRLPAIKRRPLWGSPVGIHIGAAPQHVFFAGDPFTDEFVWEKHAAAWSIHGSDNPTTAFAVYRFVEQVLGWHYFQPGELGLERMTPDLPWQELANRNGILQHQRAGFVSRNFSGLISAGEGPDWQRWQGIRDRFRYNHTTQRIVTPDLFDSHPEWFAKDRHGQPKRPPFTYASAYNDHPDLRVEAVRDWHAAQVLAALQQQSPFTSEDPLPAPQVRGHPPVSLSPGALSVSLSLADSYIFGDIDPSEPLATHGYFRRWQDWSPLVFDYSNAVATRVMEGWHKGAWPSGQRPLLYFGVLAYLLWENVPPFAVHPHIVPYLTFDRSQWYDPEARANDLATVERWAAMNTHFVGTWDYIFGGGFLIPRSLSTVVSESIPALHQRGVRAYFSQISSTWPYDGHTTWLAARLLWDPTADPQALLNTYFSGFYGPAAGQVRAFFDMAEQRWMTQQASGWWLRFWQDPGQAALFLDQQWLGQLRKHLHAARRELSGAEPRFELRLRELEAAFRATEAFVESRRALWQLQELLALPDAGGEPMVVSAEQTFGARTLLLERLRQDFSDMPRARNLRQQEWPMRYFALEAQIVALLTVPDLREQLSDNHLARLQRILAAMDSQTASPGLDPLTTRIPQLHDPAFLQLDNPRVWRIQNLPADELRIERRDPAGAFVINARRSRMHQLFHAQPGSLYLAETRLRTDQSPSGEVWIQLGFYDANGKSLSESVSCRIHPLETGKNQVQRLFTSAHAPAGSVYGRLLIRFYELDPGQPVHLESAQVYQLPLIYP